MDVKQPRSVSHFLAHIGSDLMTVYANDNEFDCGSGPRIALPQNFYTDCIRWTRGTQFRWLYKAVWGAYFALRHLDEQANATTLMTRYVLWCSANRDISKSVYAAIRQGIPVAF